MKKWWLFIIIPVGFFIILFVLFVIFFAVPSHNHPHYIETYDAAASITNYKNNLSLSWNEIPGVYSAKADNLPEQGGSFENLQRTVYLWTPSEGKFYEATDITYCVSQGSPIKLNLYANSPLNSSSKSNRPIVIYVFGGGFTSGNKDRIGYDAGSVISNLLSHDFIVAAVDYKLAPENKYPTQVQDILCAIRFLKYYSNGFGGNQNEIGIFGGSVGGQLSSIVGVINGSESWQNSPDLKIDGANLSYDEYIKIPTRPQAVVNFYGSGITPVNKVQIFFTKLMSTEGYQALVSEYNGNLTLMSLANAGNFVNYNDPSFLIVQGDHDPLSLPTMTKQFYEDLRSYNNDATYILVANASHEFLPSPPGSIVNPSIDEISNDTVNFFWKNLGNEESIPNPNNFASAQESSSQMNS